MFQSDELLAFLVVLGAFLVLGRAFLHYLARLSGTASGTGCGSCGCGKSSCSTAEAADDNSQH